MNYIHKNENAIYYECGYSCDNAIYLSLGNDNYFFTDNRYDIEANEQITNSQIIITRNLLQEAISILKKNNISKITLDPNEWSMKEYLLFNDVIPKIDKKEKLSQKKRMVKSDEEIELLRQAVKLGSDGFDKFAKYISKKGIGKSEKQLAFKNLTYMTNKLELEVSFDAIVAINANSAKPHAHPSGLKLQEKDILLVDAGIKYKRYCSDRTRVCDMYGDIHFKNNQKFKNKTHQKIYDIVKKAHDEALIQARVGMKASDIDAIARKVIEKSAYGKYFIHSTGHGVGLDIHELPFISDKSSDIIENNMVFTIEPGIYLPDEFGVRFENMVVMTDGRAVIL
jgi:Xaa-Pro aminopeptidase